jgi:N-acetylglucosamine-6-sulfatase
VAQPFAGAIARDLLRLIPSTWRCYKNRIVRRLPIVLLAFAAVVAGARGAAAAPTGAGARRRHPNILFVLTDDLDDDELRWMPFTRHLVGDAGVTFDHYFVSNSLCCPSRVTTLRGQYAHNTGVWTNGGTNGGFEAARERGIERDTVATRLFAAGYRTALVGKYLNGYPNTVPPSYVPLGWSTWVSPVAGHPYGEYRYLLNDNLRFEGHGATPRDYGTDVYVRRTQHFIRTSVRMRQPFFAYLALYAPHQPATPAPQDVEKFPRARVPRDAAYNQVDVRAMPRFVRDLPRFNRGERAAIDELYRLRLRSLQAVDRGLRALVHTLRVTHQLDNTYVVFTSDNGFHLGQHRLPAGKQTAYDTDIHAPLLVRGPGIPHGSRVTRLTGNLDLAPTFETMVGLRPPSFTDGRSLLPLAQGHAPTRPWRSAYLIEHRNETGVSAPSARPRSLPLEPADPDQAGLARRHPWPRAHGHLLEPRDKGVLTRHAPIPDYDAVRTADHLYVEYANGDRELYDTRRDPHEVHNLAGAQPRLERSLAARIRRLQHCAGRDCRVADSNRPT